MGGTYVTHVDDKYTVLVGKPKGNKTTWKVVILGYIKMNLKEIRHEEVDWIQLFQVRVQWRISEKMVMNLNFRSCLYRPTYRYL
jgi:hypothetical protein